MSEKNSDITDIIFEVDEDVYKRAEKMAKKMGFKNVDEFALFTIMQYLKSTNDENNE